MFATLLGALPRPAVITPPDRLEPDSVEAAIEMAIRAQEAAGLEPITDGRLGDPDFARIRAALVANGPPGDPGAGRPREVDEVINRWRVGAGLTDRMVKQALPGPYSVGRRGGAVDRASEHRGPGRGEGGRGDSRRRPGELDVDHGERSKQRDRAMLQAAEALGDLARRLAGAGCVLVEIEETEAHLIGFDASERALFREAHRRLTDGAGQGTHLSLSIVGGSAAGAGLDTILDAPYSSLAVDLIAGPDNWNLVTRSAGERGVIAGVLSAGDVDESREVMLWAAHYAASSGGRRGLERVGLGSAGSYANLAWEAAVRKMEHLGAVARLAAMPPGEELARSLDPRAVSSRRAAVGHGAGPRPKRRRGG